MLASERPACHWPEESVDKGHGLCAYFVLFLSAVITFSPNLTAGGSGAAQKHSMYILN